MNVAIGAKSDVGQVRQANEDSFLVQEPVFVVADGMGGHLAGDVASATAVKMIADGSKEADKLAPQDLAEMLRRANATIWDKANSDPSMRGMGTTCTLLMLDDRKAHIAHVGDSRAYLLRGDELKQVTDDHSLVGRLVREGKLTPEEAERHPQRSIITRALGVDANVDVDLFSVELQDGDRLMMCSDGLSSMTNDASIREVLLSEEDPQAAADRLVDLANSAGGEDNITVVILDIGAKSKAVGAAPRRGDTVQSARRGDTREARKPEARRKPRRRLLIAFLTLVVLGAAAFAGAKVYLGSQWFVGLNNAGFVTIFEGRPEQVFGWSLRTTENETDLHVTAVPQTFHDKLQQGIVVGSFEDAEKQVQSLRERAEDPEFNPTSPSTPTPTPSPAKPSPDKGDEAKNEVGGNGDGDAEK